MEKLEKFFITTLVAGLVAFSSVLVLPTQVTQALITENQIADNAVTSPKIKDNEVKSQDLANGAVTSNKISPFALKIVVVQRECSCPYPIPAQTQGGTYVQCGKGEVVTGGGFYAGGAGGRDVHVTGSKKNTNGWEASFFNTGDQSSTVKIYAECAHLEVGGP